MRVVFHIGLNKTGTSSLQKFLSMNAENLAHHGWLYPKAGGDGVAHHEIFHAARRGVRALQEIRAQMAEEAGGKLDVIVSSEALHDTGHVDRIAEAFRGCDVEVVIFLRDYVDYLSSWYREDVQSSGLCSSFQDYAALKRKPFVPILKRWEQHFGKEAIHVRDYNREALLNGSSIDEIMCGILKIPSVSGWNTVGYENNPSVSGNLLFLKRIVNNFIPRNQAANFGAEITDLAKIEPTFRAPMSITPEFQDFLMGSIYGYDRQRLKNEYNVDLTVRSGGREGSLIPDMSRLKSDYELIQAECSREGYSFGTPLERFAPNFCLK